MTFLNRFCRNRGAVLGLVILLAVVAFALLVLRMLRSPSFTATVDARTGQMSIVPPASTHPED